MYKRSIYAFKDIKKGEKFSRNNIKIIRPGYGVSPKYFDSMLNQKSLRNIKAASPIKKHHYKK